MKKCVSVFGILLSALSADAAITGDYSLISNECQPDIEVGSKINVDANDQYVEIGKVIMYQLEPNQPPRRMISDPTSWNVGKKFQVTEDKMYATDGEYSSDFTSFEFTETNQMTNVLHYSVKLVRAANTLTLTQWYAEKDASPKTCILKPVLN